MPTINETGIGFPADLVQNAVAAQLGIPAGSISPQVFFDAVNRNFKIEVVNGTNVALPVAGPGGRPIGTGAKVTRRQQYLLSNAKRDLGAALSLLQTLQPVSCCTPRNSAGILNAITVLTTEVVDGLSVNPPAFDAVLSKFETIKINVANLKDQYGVTIKSTGGVTADILATNPVEFATLQDFHQIEALVAGQKIAVDSWKAGQSDDLEEKFATISRLFADLVCAIDNAISRIRNATDRPCSWADRDIEWVYPASNTSKLKLTTGGLLEWIRNTAGTVGPALLGNVGNKAFSDLTPALKSQHAGLVQLKHDLPVATPAVDEPRDLIENLCKEMGDPI